MQVSETSLRLQSRCWERGAEVVAGIREHEAVKMLQNLPPERKAESMSLYLLDLTSAFFLFPKHLASLKSCGALSLHITEV